MSLPNILNFGDDEYCVVCDWCIFKFGYELPALILLHLARLQCNESKHFVTVDITVKIA